MSEFRIGLPVEREEDSRLLRGRGRYADDVNAASQARAFVLRSPHAHAEIRSIDATAASFYGEMYLKTKWKDQKDDITAQNFEEMASGMADV